jgi:hypothetical protein
MKRFLLSVFILILLVACTFASPPVFIGNGTNPTYDDTPPLPTTSHHPVPQPTHKPIPECITVSQWNLSLSLNFGEYTGIYTGQLIGGLPSGKGLFSVAEENGTGWTYDGEWKNGHFNGSGTVTWKDGFISSGIYKNDYLNGEGCKILYGTTQYQGGFRHGYYHGQGTLFNQHGDTIYSGPFYYGLIQESAEDRGARIDAFKILCVTPSVETLYQSCKYGMKKCAKISGTIFDIYYDNIENPTYCDFLIYEQNKSNTNHIVCVIYTLSEGEEPPAEDQSVTIWGTTEYPYSYTTTDNKDLTVPLIKAFSVEMDS